jgi:ribonuclease HII
MTVPVGDGRTVSEITKALQQADRAEFDTLSRALAADERKGVRHALEVARRRIEAEEAETARLDGMYATMRAMCPAGYAVGLDEVGRGPVAGPLAVGAVVLPDEPHIEGLNDSKQLTPAKREEIARIVKDVAVAWDIEYIEPHFIDENGMTVSLRTAFTRAIKAIEDGGVEVRAVLLDGNPLHLDPREKNLVKGDAKCAPIAAASIIAKVDRDALMSSYATEYPEYGFELNKGYASPEHIEAIKAHGLTPLHRASFCHAWTQETLF